jgi:hypothetical protein
VKVISAEWLAGLTVGTRGRHDERAWRDLVALVHRPPPERPVPGVAVSSAAELRALEQAPGDPRRAQALSAALAERANADPDFRANLDEWRSTSRREPHKPAPATGSASKATNHVSGGTFFNAVIQGRDITVQLPRETPRAMSGLPVRAANFTGRDVQLGEPLDLLRPDVAGLRQRPVAAAVTGLAGVGKTELVLQAAARAIAEPSWFPGGVLFVDLFGYDGELRLSPERALGPWLRALGVAAIFRECGDVEREAIVLTNLGSHLLACGRPEEAVVPLRRALALCPETGDMPVRSVAVELLKAARSRTG